MRILVVEDEVHMAEALSDILQRNHYTVDTVYDGEAGEDYAMSGIYDAVILDIMLPKQSGITVLQNIRKCGNTVPVLLLTAKGDVSDKVTGLDSGADDYLAKPFYTEELLARIRAMLRRKDEAVSDTIHSLGDIQIDTSTLKISCCDSEVTLTQKEFELLEFLLANRPAIVPKERIIEKLWGFESEAEANHVEVYISFLRKKLKFLSSTVTICTVRGLGYRLEVPHE